METGLQNTNNIQWPADDFFSAVFGVHNAIKVAQWYAVQEGDATMMPIASLPGQKIFFTFLSLV